MRILVTGGSGFLGSWTARAFLAAGANPIVLTRTPRPYRLATLPDLDVISAPLPRWSEEIATLRPDVLVSLDWAGVSGPLRDDESQWANLERQRSLVESAIRAGVRRIVITGSQAEYGPRTDRVREDVPLAPVTAYGRAKVEALNWLVSTCEAAGIEWVWARVFSVYGPMDNEGVLLQLVGDALRAGRALELSSGEQLWSYLYASDAGRALALLATAMAARGVYNVGHPEAPRLRDTVERFARMHGGVGGLRFGEKSAMIGRLEPDTDRLVSLGWWPDTSLEDGLAATAAWLGGATLVDRLLPGLTLPLRPVPLAATGPS